MTNLRATLVLLSVTVACAEPPANVDVPRAEVLVPPGPTPEVLRAREGYATARAALEHTRRELAGALDAARGARAKARVVARARAALLDAFDEVVMPAWTGTAWEFSGTSSTPGDGAIACGHFVATVIQHLGFDVNRIRLGQLASEHILRTFVAAADVRRFSNRDAATVVERVRDDGDGLYVLGLDRHAALLRVHDGAVDMCHSALDGVLCEPAETSVWFESRYRVTGKLFDDAMVHAWLAGTRYEPYAPTR